jgi:hypothetical protein
VPSGRNPRTHLCRHRESSQLPLYEPPSAFRAVALNLPWVYALERSGSLHIFRLPAGEKDAHAPVVHVLKNAGDGHDLKVIGEVLVCTRYGQLAAYSLKDPARPHLLRRAGPNSAVLHDSQSIVCHRDLAFVLGRDGILSYDLADRTRPRLLAAQKVLDCGWVGCMVSNRLCVGDRKRKGETGISIFDVSDPSHLREIGFAPAKRTVYGAAVLGENRLFVSMDANPFDMSQSLTFGEAAIFDVARPEEPSLVGAIRDIGGRSSAVVPRDGGALVISNGAVHRVMDRSIDTLLRFERFGTNRDGFPYHADYSQGLVAIATDQEITILRLE